MIQLFTKYGFWFIRMENGEEYQTTQRATVSAEKARHHVKRDFPRHTIELPQSTMDMFSADELGADALNALPLFQ